jgi:hypothetical protein
VPGGRRGEAAAGGRRGTRLNLEGLGEAVSDFVMEGGEVAGDRSNSLCFPFVRGTGSSLGTDTWTGSGNAASVLAGEGNPELVEEPSTVGEEGRSFEGERSKSGVRVLSASAVGYSLETATTFSES